MGHKEQDIEGQGSQRISAWRIALKSFTSQWFLIPQGTGILSICLHQIHYQFHGLAIISQIFWVLTIVTLLGFLLIYLLRIALYPKHVAQQLGSNIMETSCLSSISIAFATIFIMIALNLVSTWSQSWGMVCFVMFWLNTALSTVACIGIPYVFTKVEGAGIDGVPPGTLLPLISALTNAAAGGVICRYGMLGANLQVPVIIVSYLLIGLALPMSVVVDAVFLARIFDQAFPIKQKVYQLMILCGPLGQGSFALQILGQVVQRGAFASYNNSSFVGASGASVISTCSELLGLITWGYGTFWWVFACIGIVHYLISAPRELIKWDKSLASWSMVFPWGVYTNGAIQLGVVLDSRAFWVWSTTLTLLLVILWLLNAAASLLGVANGQLLELNRGWGAKYYTHTAEEEKEQQRQEQSQQDSNEDEKKSEGSEEQSQGGDAQQSSMDGTYERRTAGLRQRDQ